MAIDRYVDRCRKLGDAIFRAMSERGMEPEEFARRMGVSNDDVYKIIHGANNPTLMEITKMEEVLQVNLIKIQ